MADLESENRSIQPEQLIIRTLAVHVLLILLR